jgi:NDP-sugar pyrophosphorylase family protein
MLKMPRAIVLAGGKGTRLLPYTVVIPKPMLPIGEIPIIEIISRQLKYHGFDEVTVSLGHLSGVIEHYLETKANLSGIPNFEYFQEQSPLGTSGPIKAISPKEENFLVVNGDILTTLNMHAMWEEHLKQDAVLTVGIRKTEYRLPLGSITVDKNSLVTNFEEKPTVTYLDNIGAYVYSKHALKYMEEGERIDVNILIERLIKAKEKVLAFRSDGPYFWIDIGTHADYEKANLEFTELRKSMPFLKEMDSK